MSLRFHEIAESTHTLLNPFSEAKLTLLGEICSPAQGTRMLDLACGKGELLIRWARAYGVIGVGVDISEVFLAAARQRADELEVIDQVNFVQDDAAQYPQPFHEFDVVSCIGATWIGGGLIGTLELMKTALKPRDGLILVGEPYWHVIPDREIANSMDTEPDTYATLGNTLNRFESVGLELVEMVLADLTDWDRYEAKHWMAVDTYLREHPDDPEADALRAWMRKWRRNYLEYGRDYMGWGIFVLRPQ